MAALLSINNRIYKERNRVEVPAMLYQAACQAILRPVVVLKRTVRQNNAVPAKIKDSLLHHCLIIHRLHA